ERDNPHLYVRKLDEDFNKDALRFSHTMDYRIAPVRGMHDARQLNELAAKLFHWINLKMLKPEAHFGAREKRHKLEFPQLIWREPIARINANPNAVCTITDEYAYNQGYDILVDKEPHNDIGWRTLFVRILPDPNIVDLSLDHNGIPNIERSLEWPVLRQHGLGYCRRQWRRGVSWWYGHDF
ncbi:MAG: hypothetical protein ACE5FT_00380, partial [Candidatus Nanoarchaeia archaeon]